MKQEVHFVTGKGGVGKSAVAAALALSFAAQGHRTLLIELGERSFYKDYFDLDDVSFDPRDFRKNLQIARWSGRESLRDYARHLIRVDKLTDLFFDNPVSRTLLEIAPALSELAILGKATSGPRRHGPALPYDRLVIDAYATGHFLALLRAPRGMAEAIRFGPMGEQSRGIDEVLKNSEIVKVHLVTLPEELPVKESEELIETLRDEFALRPQLILNKWVPADGIQNFGGEPQAFYDFLASTQKRQNEMAARLTKQDLPFRKLPYLLEEDGAKLVQRLAEEAGI